MKTMFARAAALALTALLPTTPGWSADAAQSDKHPEAKPFDETADADAQVHAALERAAASGHETILVFGANWCHDSRSLAGWFATPRFKSMLDQRYEVVWIDVGMKDRNIDLARHFGLDGIEGTPTVLILDAEGDPRNLEDAVTWRNAASRKEDAIYDYFAGETAPGE